MNALAVAITALVALAIAACVVASLGVLLMRNAYARLHYVGLVTAVAAPLCAIAVALAEGLWPAGAKALLVAAVMVVTGPVVTHATARAARSQFENGSTRAES